jgi:hydrogenase/urease accessory protein HupE
VKRVLWFIWAGLFAPLPVVADELQPFYIEVVQTGVDVFTLDYQAAPGQGQQTAQLMPPCALVSKDRRLPSLAPSQTSVYECVNVSEDLVVTRSAPAVSPPALLRFKRLSGQIDLYYLKAGDHQQTLSLGAPDQGAFVQYLALGFDHILIGYDHLLFILCLVLLAGSLRRILVMVTGFTLAHSITLGLAVMDILRAPIALIELLIALSVLLLAVELAKGPRETLTHRHPIVVSSLFGLLHGLGFAAALTQIGLPSADVAWALLAFNVGVELGQVLFVTALLAIAVVVQRATQPYPNISGALRQPLIYGIGIISGYWVMARADTWFY